ncbi:5-oxoprolinase/urea amidolyase family protein, partial [Rhodococcus sp. MEB064]|uniref:5-oxoprolinase/urea amidolyase family protein n=1 Tax=Rhodococcus sp. MEB064 TaxID=1587522 RepID=UPI0005AC4256
MLTTIQDWPGRVGYWKVGVPPSGPMDDLSLRLANIAVGNPEGAPALETTMSGPALRFDDETVVCVTGADAPVTVNGIAVERFTPVTVPAGGVLDVGLVSGAGLRMYIAIRGGVLAEEYLGSASTFTLGTFGGKDGRVLKDGDDLELDTRAVGTPASVPMEHVPALTHAWQLAVTEGPHGAPEFFTRADMDTILGTDYEVHFNSDRTGVRLVGPRPDWARTDGGEAGLHPSNIHDNAYSVGALDFTGDTPILLGPDGPSLGGFVCPVTVVAADRWKLGQLRPGDTVRFVPIEVAAAASKNTVGLARRASLPVVFSRGGDGDDGVIARRDGLTPVTYRRSGDDNILVEYGEMSLDLALRARVHALHEAVQEIGPAGLVDLTPGIRSLQVKVDPDVLPTGKLLDLLLEAEAALPDTSELSVPSRHVRLPLSWDDPSTREAIQRYMHGVRSDAPWCPWNIEFIRRMNGLDSVDDVYDTVFDAEYMVLGLGDVA